MSGTGTSAQGNRVSQPLAAISKVEYATIAISIEMAAGARKVSVFIHSPVVGVVEDLLAQQDIAGQQLIGNRAPRSPIG